MHGIKQGFDRIIYNIALTSYSVFSNSRLRVGIRKRKECWFILAHNHDITLGFTEGLIS